jgi:hypothetical protein
LGDGPTTGTRNGNAVPGGGNETDSPIGPSYGSGREPSMGAAWYRRRLHRLVDGSTLGSLSYPDVSSLKGSVTCVRTVVRSPTELEGAWLMLLARAVASCSRDSLIVLSAFFNASACLLRAALCRNSTFSSSLMILLYQGQKLSRPSSLTLSSMCSNNVGHASRRPLSTTVGEMLRVFSST